MSETRLNPVFIPLTARRLIVVSGPDARGFLHNLLTADIAHLAQGAGTLTALLSPQGKIISDSLLYDASDEEPLFLMDVAQGFVETLLGKFALYKLRASVEIAALGAEIACFAVFDAPTITGEAFYSFSDPRHAALGQRLYGPMDALRAALSGISEAPEAAYHMRRIRLGVPETGVDYPPLDAFPHEALFDQLGGVDFRKGCYIGQEIVSRMEHRGTARTRALPVAFENGFGVSGGAEVLAGGISLGHVGESYGGHAIAMLRLDRLEEALKAGEVVRAGGVPITVQKPDFLRFSVPGCA